MHQSVVAPKKTLLEQMQANPAGDWTIADIRTLCQQVGMVLEEPSGGSHFKVYSDSLDGPLTVPARRPIKPVYIRMLVSKAKAHMRENKGRSD